MTKFFARLTRFTFVVAICLLPGLGAAAETAPPASLIQNLTSDNFTDTLEAGKQTALLVQFSAAWCGYCKRMSPYIEKLAADDAGKLKVYRVDVDDEPRLAEQYNVHGLPTLVIIVKGQVVAQGYVPETQLKDWVGEYVDPAAPGDAAKTPAAESPPSEMTPDKTSL